MGYKTRYTYKIMPYASLTQAMIDNVNVVQDGGLSGVRKSVDSNPQEDCVIKWTGIEPANLVGLGTNYTHEEVLSQLTGTHWEPTP